MINTLILCISINLGMLENTQSALSGDALATLNTQVQLLTSTPSYMFLLSGVERLVAICVQISLSVIVFYSVARRDKRWLFPLAILLHAAADTPAAMYQVGVIKNIFVVEGGTAAVAVVLVLLAVFFHRLLKTPETEMLPVASAKREPDPWRP